MLVDIDISALEVVTAAFLSQDPVLIQELWNGIDIHDVNRVKFGLPSRLIAKTFKFRLLYGGNEFSFVHDPNFSCVSTSKKYWSDVIEEYYTKYNGIKLWHNKLIEEAITTGQIVSPFGRMFHYEQKMDKRGEWQWPVTTIKNYIVQGTGADLVMIGRITLANRIKKLGLKSVLIMTVHDSIAIDCPEEEWQTVAQLALDCIKDIPKNIQYLFGFPFNLNLTGKVMYGPNLKEMKEWN